MAKETMELIKTEDFLSPENLDAYHKELMEKVNSEKEAAENELNAIMPLNPQKVADKVLYNLRLIERKINDSEDYADGGKWITKFTAGNINAMVDES